MVAVDLGSVCEAHANGERRVHDLKRFLKSEKCIRYFLVKKTSKCQRLRTQQRKTQLLNKLCLKLREYLLIDASAKLHINIAELIWRHIKMNLTRRNGKLVGSTNAAQARRELDKE